MVGLIFGSVPCEHWDFLNDYLNDSVRVFCADGGVLNAAAAGRKADVLIGDWDSGGKAVADLPCITLPVEKDLTDLQAAAGLALEEGYTELVLCGCTGGRRLDHTASNLVLLEWIADRGGRGLLVDPENEVRLLDAGYHVVENRPALHYFSLVPLDRHVTGVTLEGAKYPLNQAVLTRGDTLSVSNEPMAHQVGITIAEGRALLIRSERGTQF